LAAEAGPQLILKCLPITPSKKRFFGGCATVQAVEHIRKFGHNPNYLSSVEIKVPAAKYLYRSKIAYTGGRFYIAERTRRLFKRSLEGITPADLEGKKIVSAIKGIVPDENKIIGEFLNEKYEGVPFDDFLVISGPCHAEEVALEKLSYLTIASQDTELAAEFAGMLSTRYIKTIVSDDIYGTEYGAVLKTFTLLPAVFAMVWVMAIIFRRY
jgi:glycerol-3-phosphate dehydrogenase (NAD(P)+)